MFINSHKCSYLHCETGKKCKINLILLFFFPFRCSKWVQPNKPKTHLRFKPSVFLLSAPTITRLPLRRLGAGERLSPPRGFPLTSLDLCRQAGVGVGAGKRGAEDVARRREPSGCGSRWQQFGSAGRVGGLGESRRTKAPVPVRVRWLQWIQNQHFTGCLRRSRF